MTCDRCGSSQLLDLSAKCSDLCHVQDVNGGNERDGYVPSNIGIGGGDYVEFRYCLECGKIQGNFPLANPFETQ